MKKLLTALRNLFTLDDQQQACFFRVLDSLHYQH